VAQQQQVRVSTLHIPETTLLKHILEQVGIGPGIEKAIKLGPHLFLEPFVAGEEESAIDGRYFLPVRLEHRSKPLRPVGPEIAAAACQGTELIILPGKA